MTKGSRTQLLKRKTSTYEYASARMSFNCFCTCDYLSFAHKHYSSAAVKQRTLVMLFSLFSVRGTPPLHVASSKFQCIVNIMLAFLKSPALSDTQKQAQFVNCL
ncbi:hypothetical protein V5799_016244 [Amblyomma americanum]|uniref:Uncharacterized protein n=1 Tax=Amblyomma americanum TaxID=6943 RepID=A0AAQ4F700_AMBAM